MLKKALENRCQDTCTCIPFPRDWDGGVRGGPISQWAFRELILDTEDDGGIAPPLLLLFKVRHSSDGTDARVALVLAVFGDKPTPFKGWCCRSNESQYRWVSAASLPPRRRTSENYTIFIRHCMYLH